ncbi:MAG: hypothetical protein KAH14_07665 [Clostridiales bacterium]|nr:hypothetical protein [Clostridiales bacterium]
MFLLKDAIWQIMLEDERKDEVVRQLNDILSCYLNLQEHNQSDADIYIGTPSGCKKIQLAVDKGLIDLNNFGPDDHIIKTVIMHDKTCVFISGVTENAAVYGVFSFLEEIGYLFLASQTISPELGIKTVIPEIDKKYSTANKWRGLFVSFCMVSTSIMSLMDFNQLFDNMLRMKLNRIVFYPFENEPIIDYTFQGERKVVGDISRPESGYFSYGRHWTGSFNVDEISIGQEKYAPRKRVAPMEFQNVNSSDEALNTGKAFMNDIISEAAKRRIGVWIAFLPQFVSMNMTKYLKPMPRKNLHWSALVSCTDPVVKDINAARINNIVKSYPKLEGIFIGIPEGFYEDPYSKSREYIDSQLPEYEEALNLQKKFWGDHWPGDKLQQKHIEADIAFSKVAIETLEEAAKYQPNIKLGLITVCKAYLLTKLHELLPKDVAFCDIESRSLWTHGGAPLHLFKTMKGRECSIIPRITDDGSQAGMQFNVNLYYKDGYCRSAIENGTTGFMMQTLFIKGADHNIKYLADGLWNQQITPKSFYKKYLNKVYGEKAAVKIEKAYAILEINEEYMGGRGAANMPWNHVPPEIAVMRSFKNFDNPFHESPLQKDFLINSRNRASIYKETIKRLNEAAGLFESANNDCIGDALLECSYMEIRTRAYAMHLKTMVTLSEIYLKYSEAFTKGNIVENMQHIIDKCREARDLAVQSAELFEECVSHTTDLAPLWMINSSMVKGTETLFQFIFNILAFHKGDEYWNPVNWDILFGGCPYPAHGINMRPDKDQSMEEPG